MDKIVLKLMSPNEKSGAIWATSIIPKDRRDIKEEILEMSTSSSVPPILNNDNEDEEMIENNESSLDSLLAIDETPQDMSEDTNDSVNTSDEQPPVLAAMTSSDPMAAVVFEPTSRSFTVIDDAELLSGSVEGVEIEHEGQMYTVMALFPTTEEAQMDCERRVSELNSSSCLPQLFFNGVHNGSSMDGDSESTAEQPEVVDVNCDEVTAELFNAGEPSPEPQEKSHNDDALEAVRYMFAVYYNELAEDMARINKRQETLSKMMEDVLGGRWATGAVDGRLQHDPKQPLLLKRIGTKKFSRLFPPPAHLHASLDDNDEDYQPASSNSNEGRSERKRTAALPENREKYKRSRYEDDDSDSVMTFSNGAYRPQAHPGYPFMSRDDEEECFRQARGSAANYAQRISRLLFKDTLELYFKDQEPKRRTWIHEIIDYRFPSEDKQMQMYKWKNCSWAINKNRYQKDIPEPPVRKESVHNGEKKRSGLYKTWTGREEKVSKPDFPYVSESIEQEVFAQCPQDAVKYTELLAFRLFPETRDRLFSEQDGAKKEWLRDVVDWRFAMEDKLKRDARWKVCGAAANRNRLKQVVNGEAVAYPYVSKEFEESCLRAARGNPTVYAELMGRGLFSDNIDVSFKDQDPSKRTWLHDILDRRFPTMDKLKQIQKWKLCSSAINKNRTLTSAQIAASVAETNPPTPTSVPSVNRSGRSSEIKEESVKGRETRDKESRKKDEKEKEKKVEEPPRRSIKRTVEREPSPPPAPVKEVVRTSEATNTRSAIKAKQQQETVTPTVPDKKKRKSVIADSGIQLNGLNFDLTEDKEDELFTKSDGIVGHYAKGVAQILFKDNLNAYFKDQDEDRRQLLKRLVDVRFPTPKRRDHELKWKSCSNAINKNRTDSFK